MLNPLCCVSQCLMLTVSPPGGLTKLGSDPMKAVNDAVEGSSSVLTSIFSFAANLIAPDEDEGTDVKVTVRPVGYNESTVVRVQAHCRCRCGLPGRCRNPDQSQCRADSTPTNGEAPRKPVQAYSRDSEQNPGERKTPCRAEGAELECGGRGACECGSCVCEQSKLGAVYGAHCEMDDFSCPYKDGLLCGGET